MKVEPPTTMSKTRHGSIKGAGPHDTIDSNIELIQRLTAIKTPNGKWTVSDLPKLQKHWEEDFADLFGGIPLELPPFREISHEINLIDENKRYNYHLPKCPDSLRPELAEKVKRYTTAGWWVPATACQAAPMLCVHKKSGKLRTVIDFRLQNDNLIKDVTPFPDQDAIRHDVARAKF